MSLTLAREELREFISSGETQKAIENLADKEDGGIDGDGNTLYHQAVLDQDNQLLRCVLLLNTSRKFFTVVLSLARMKRINWGLNLYLRVQFFVT